MVKVHQLQRRKSCPDLNRRKSKEIQHNHILCPCRKQHRPEIHQVQRRYSCARALPRLSLPPPDLRLYAQIIATWKQEEGKGSGRKIAPCPRVGDQGEEDGMRPGSGRGGEDESAQAAVKWSLGATLQGGGEGASVAEARRTGYAPAAVEAGRREVRRRRLSLGATLRGGGEGDTDGDGGGAGRGEAAVLPLVRVGPTPMASANSSSQFRCFSLLPRFWLARWKPYSTRAAAIFTLPGRMAAPLESA
jgi:hypothetical protein